jgi:predicted MFS family arabinose efflux permease
VSARKRLTLFLLCLASFIAVVDTTIVTIALPSMRRDPGFSGAEARWILNGYALAFGGLVLLLLATFREHTFLNLSDYMVKIQACKVVFTLNKYGGSG